MSVLTCACCKCCPTTEVKGLEQVDIGRNFPRCPEKKRQLTYIFCCQRFNFKHITVNFHHLFVQLFRRVLLWWNSSRQLAPFSSVNSNINLVLGKQSACKLTWRKIYGYWGTPDARNQPFENGSIC